MPLSLLRILLAILVSHCRREEKISFPIALTDRFPIRFIFIHRNALVCSHRRNSCMSSNSGLHDAIKRDSSFFFFIEQDIVVP